ncbi:hypothetical protein HPB49_006100 [Dermacentor silvarum]|uniref:Uncharacterized protein n=1 Tax=Dermacentor silvarum TaxID=543639 RepID=A0ACB8DWF5_DERSI|nr:hypothetical protein HPB49_006100 [Dermacentor silvarum]
MRTDWARRVYQIEKKYGFFGEEIEADTATKWSSEVRRRVKEAETTIWSKEMESKSTLELYRRNKRGISAECFYDNSIGISVECFYDNSIGSSLMFEARTGALRTLVYCSRFQDTGICSKCRLCGAETETQEHLIFRCAGLQTAPAEDTDLHRALGFHTLEAEDGNDIANGRNVGRNCAVVATKKRLKSDGPVFCYWNFYWNHRFCYLNFYRILDHRGRRQRRLTGALLSRLPIVFFECGYFRPELVKCLL